MMLSTIITKTFLDRWKGEAIAAVSLAVLFFFGMAVYRDIDLAVYTDLPEVLRAVMNIPPDADVGALAYGAVFSAYGALTLASLALSMGSASIAGEERGGTMGLLLANPKTRSHVLVSKAVNIVLLTALGSIILWAAGLVVPALLDVDVTGIEVGALTFHIFVNAVFHGFVALAISAWTGKTSLASGATVAVMVLSFFAVGLLPLIGGLENAARAFPWYYYGSSEPHINGVNWGHIGVLAAGIIALSAVAVVGVNRRDLRGQTTRVSLLDRLRANPLTRRIADRLAGSARVSRIWTKTASENQAVLVVDSFVMFSFMGVMIGAMYTFIDDTLVSLADAFPEELLAMFGGGDLSTPEGFYQLETFGFMVPAAFMVITVTIGARALAGEEAARTMGLLLANPIPRSRVVIEKTIAMVVQSVILAVCLFAGVVVGSSVGGLGMNPLDIAAATVLGTLLGLVFGGVALALGAATGRTRVAVFGTVGIALVFYLANGFLPFADGFEWLVELGPFHYYLSSDPLINGMHWGHGAVLLGLFVLLVAAAMWAFDRRDLRQAG